MFSEKKLVAGERASNKTDTITLNTEQVLDFLARKKNVNLYESYLTDTFDFPTVCASQKDILRLALQHDFDDILVTMMDESLDEAEEFLNNILALCDTWIMYYDKPKLLDNLLNSVKGLLEEHGRGFVTQMNFKCHLFRKHECKKVLMKHGFYKPDISKMPITEQEINMLIDVLLNIRQLDMKTTIVNALEEIPNLYSTIRGETKDNIEWNFHHTYNMLLTHMKNDSEVLRTILDCGIDANTTDTDGKTLLMDLLENQSSPIHFQKKPVKS